MTVILVVLVLVVLVLTGGKQSQDWNLITKCFFYHNTSQPNRDSAAFEVIVALHHLLRTFGLGKSKGPNKTWTLNFLGPKIRFTEAYEI